jgi:diguanylate cyclase (GGDEF)-like protein/PAS domain S-box-containing protein
MGSLLEFLYLTPVGIVKFRPEGLIEMANPAAAQLLMPLTVDADMTDLYRVLSALLPDLRERVARFLAPCGQICDQMQLPVPGRRTVLTLGINKINPVTLMAVIQDITAAIEQEKRIRNDQQRFRAIFENVRDYAIYTVDLEGRVDSWNRSLERIGGWRPTDVVGRPIGIFFNAAEQEACMALLDRARQFGTAEFEAWRIRKDGTRFWGNTVAAALPDPEGRPNGYVLVTRDLTERKQMEDRLVALTITDPLTGALNRRAGETRLEEAFRELRRRGRTFSLLMIDCDRFKRVNDTLGHDAGDQVLIALVRICQESLRMVDVTFRWGGEEFLVLLPGASREIALAVAERLRLAVEAATIVYEQHVIAITVSIGVAAAEDAGGSADDIMRRVDRAVYAAKAGGRNRVVAEYSADGGRSAHTSGR